MVSESKLEKVEASESKWRLVVVSECKLWLLEASESKCF